MADRRGEADQPEAAQKAADKPDDTPKPPGNPIDLGTDVDKLPPVPGAGQFMPADVATEAPAPGPGAEAAK